MKQGKIILLLLLLPCLLLGGCGEKKPSTITSVVVWNYYSSKQKDAFEQLVAQFNETVGAEKGIVVTAESKGGVDELAELVAQSAQGSVGAERLPQATAAYGDSAHELYRADILVDFSQHFTQEELGGIVPSFLSEGEFAPGEYYILPVAKSTELLYLNETDWAPFAAETGVTVDDLATWEGVVKVAQAYYEWSDGKAFFGRDAFANYPIVGSQQLGKEILNSKDGQADYQMDEAVLRRLWDGYAAPYLKGWFAAYGSFRSDDVKTGDILAFVGSTSSVTFFSDQVTTAAGETYAIERGVYPLPQFAGADPLSVQQGAGMCVLKTTPEQERATMEFFRWLTAAEQNLKFCANSGYLPVTEAAAQPDSMREALLSGGVAEDSVVYKNSMLGIQTVQSNAMYAPLPFDNGAQARGVLADWVSTELDGYRAELVGLTGEEMDLAVEAIFPRWCESLRTGLGA